MVKARLVIVNLGLLIHALMLRGPAGNSQLRWWRDLFVQQTGLETQKAPLGPDIRGISEDQ